MTDVLNQVPLLLLIQLKCHQFCTIHTVTPLCKALGPRDPKQIKKKKKPDKHNYVVRHDDSGDNQNTLRPISDNSS